MNQCAPLFRREVLDAQRVAWLGRPRLIQPISVQLVAAIGLVVVLLVTAVLVFGHYTRRVRVHGAVVPSAGVLRVFAPQTGRLLNANVVDGATVEAGAPLFLLGTDTTTGFGETENVVKGQLQSRIVEIEEAIRQRIQLDGVEKNALVQRKEAIEREIERVVAQIKQSEDYAAILQPRTIKYRKLVQRGLTVERSFENAEQNLMQIRQECETLRRQRVQLEGTAIEVGSRLEGFDASAAIAISEMRQRISVLKEQLAQAEARRAIVIAAPAKGTVAATLAHPGELVTAGTPLLSILPADENMEIQLLADSKAIGFIREGVRVMLRYTAFPYQKFGQYEGTVSNVSRVTLKPNETNVDALAAQLVPSQAQYRITVHPAQSYIKAYGNTEPLKAGWAVEADLLLDTRPLYQWLLEPIYSLRGRASGAAEYSQ